MTRVALVALAGGAGAVLRWAVAARLRHGLTVVNVVGSFVLGLAVASTAPGTARTVVAVGLCGGLTTFSGVALDRRLLARNVAASLAAAAVGLAVGG